jgi:hypothetical protein
MIETVKIPKKFADICALVRDGEADSLEKLKAYQGLEHQKIAVLAQCAYFDGDFAAGLSLDMQLCPYWNEWHYSNIGTEHIAAMAFAARILERQNEVCDFFGEQITLLEGDTDTPVHIIKGGIARYENKIEYIKTGVVPHFTEMETYRPPEKPLSVDELKAAVEERVKSKKDKPVDWDSTEGFARIFSECKNKGDIYDAIEYYEKIPDAELPDSVDWQIAALSCYNYLENEKKGFEIVLRMASQRLWYVAAHTQVRPMDFFRHPSVFPYLSDKSRLEAITEAGQQICS